MSQKIKNTYQLQKFPGKGGWTYAAIPEIAQNPENPFGWVKISGFIDDYELKHYKLMPMGNGQLFLPVKAEIRKKIKKEAGDTVTVNIWIDESEYTIPQELIDCFELESTDLLSKFEALSEGARKQYIDWIYEAKTEETKVKRISQLIDELQK